MMDQLIASQRAFFTSGATRPLARREQALRALDQSLVRHEAAVLAALQADMRKPIFEGFVSEIAPVREEIRHAIKHLKRWARPRHVATPVSCLPGRTRVTPEPLGAVLVLGPWNYPFQLILVPLVGAIAAGNVVAAKPSEWAPATAAVLKVILAEAFDEPWARLYEGDATVAQALLDQPWGHVFFTGSTRVGREVMRQAAATLSPVTLELGGKSPCLLDETCDLAIAAKRIAWGKFFNAGQTCLAPDYVLVPTSHKAEFIDHLGKAITDFFGSDPRCSPDFARIIHERHWEKLAAHFKDGRVRVGGEHDRAERYVAPTIMDDIVVGSALDTEEIFGPILAVYGYDTLDKAIALMARQPDPLALYIFSARRELMETVRRSMRFGGGCFNDTLLHFANLKAPFGGVGASGLGAYHGERSFETFSHHQTIVERPRGLDISLRYAPYKGKLGFVRRLLRV